MAAVLVAGTRAEAMRAAMEACCCGSGSGSGSGGIVYVPCSIGNIGGFTVTLDWEVASCFGGTGSAPFTGAPCGPFALFNAGTGNIFPGADTSFDPTDVPGPIILFQWCDGESTYWVLNDDYAGLIQFAFCCVTRQDGSTYLAFYASFILTCFVLGVQTGIIEWAYKSREIAYESGDPYVLSITGLTPFATQSVGVCSCGGSPEISIALTVDVP